MKTIVEPFRIKAVEPICLTTRAERKRLLEAAPYIEGGIRGCEIGSVMFGRQPDGSEEPAAMELVRLAIPRRVYTQSHIDYVIEVTGQLYARRDALRGVRITKEPKRLRHFTAQFAPKDGALFDAAVPGS